VAVGFGTIKHAVADARVRVREHRRPVNTFLSSLKSATLGGPAGGAGGAAGGGGSAAAQSDAKKKAAGPSVDLSLLDFLVVVPSDAENAATPSVNAASDSARSAARKDDDCTLCRRARCFVNRARRSTTAATAPVATSIAFTSGTLGAASAATSDAHVDCMSAPHSCRPPDHALLLLLPVVDLVVSRAGSCGLQPPAASARSELTPRSSLATDVSKSESAHSAARLCSSAGSRSSGSRHRPAANAEASVPLHSCCCVCDPATAASPIENRRSELSRALRRGTAFSANRAMSDASATSAGRCRETQSSALRLDAPAGITLGSAAPLLLLPLMFSGGGGSARSCWEMAASAQ
jgi:hypothetical protein